MTKRTAKELWDALDEATLDAEIESELAMTPEERRRALVKAGYDLDEVHAQADAFFARGVPVRDAPRLPGRGGSWAGQGRAGDAGAHRRRGRRIPRPVGAATSSAL
jgi:hypothetical protein